MKEARRRCIWQPKTTNFKQCSVSSREHKATVDKVNRGGRTALHIACSKAVDLAEFLLDKGADLNKRDRDDWTPLMYSVKNNRINCVKVLLARNADTTVKATNRLDHGKTALDIAREMKLDAIVAVLRVVDIMKQPKLANEVDTVSQLPFHRDLTIVLY